ncbi:lytic murein transglycosylase [Modestobacter sp. L9-4]|uniref:LytR C-terminal domain-containing protein n=1 Tax=Modestobacter sp. L9-4 TaxID=2851567 RepID=UPI001C75D1EA|nr:LytR C-terminal domain-containing protein [Modestobacter sp. L9-4]QXG75314.1 lytic murein transglycosylase [Modestobacter sp. L9-4]
MTAGLTTALVALLPGASAAPALLSAAPVPGGELSAGATSSASRLSAHRSDPDLLASPVLEGAALEEAASAAAAPGTSSPRSPDAARSPLAAGGVPTTAMEAYTRAAELADCGISWTLIAAIGRVESNHGRFAGAVLSTDGLSTPPVVGIPLTGNGTARILDSDGGRFDGDTVHDRAVGPMQFIPTTWAVYGADGNGDGVRDPFNIYDAAAATGDYLCAAGGDLSSESGQARAVFAYNHSDEYVATVLGLSATYAGTPPPHVPTTTAPAVVVPPADPGRPPAIGRVPQQQQAPRASEDRVVVVADGPAVPAFPSLSSPARPEPATREPETSKPETPQADPSKSETSKPEAPKSETSKPETPVTPETPKPESPKPETPKPETPKPSEKPASSPEPPAAPTPGKPTTQTPATPTPEEPTTQPPATPTPEEPTAQPPATPTPEEPTTQPPATSTPPASEPPTSSTPPATPPTTEPSPTPAPPTDSCEPAAGTTVDVLDGTGDPALGELVAQKLRDGGLTVGTVTTGAAATSGIEFAEADRARAERLAEVLGETDLLRTGTGEHVTVVLGADDADALVEAFRAFTGLPC